MAYTNNQNQGMGFPIYPQLIDPRSGNPPFPFFINPNHYQHNNGQILYRLVSPPNPQLLRPPPELTRIEEARYRSLLEFMTDEGLIPSQEEERKRKNAIDKLREVVMEWIKMIAHRNGVNPQNMNSVSAAVLTYGSYGLGAHNSESDIDALCVGPCFATLKDDFFVILHDMLTRRAEVSEVHCIKDAKVPLMRFKLDGISIDLPYAQLKVSFVPENVDVRNPLFLKNIDETSWRSLSGVHANKCILQFVPNLMAFQMLLRCIKLWAKKRGVYGNLFGFFGGVHLAIMAAFICQRHPNATLTSLIPRFFKTFAFWSWPTPVCLQDGLPQVPLKAGVRTFMPIKLPCKTDEYCHSNITESTFYKIHQELIRGNNLCQDLFKPDFDWACLFDTFSYANNYTRFVKICLSASGQDELGEWTGWVKSRFRALLVKLEAVHGFCDPNPTEHVDIHVSGPNVVFFWGLEPENEDFLDIRSVQGYFVKNLCRNYQGPTGRISLSVVQASQLPKTALSNPESHTSVQKI